jgi:hypothetical protein
VAEGLSLTCPGRGSQAVDLPVGGVRKPGEDVAQIGLGIDAATAAAFDDGIKDGGALPGLGFADEQQFFFPSAVGRIAFSTRFWSISMRPSSR